MKNINASHLCELVESRTNHSRSFSFAPDYAERGYSSPEKGIVFGNWNPVCGFNKTKQEQKRDPVSKLARILESAGFELEWEDEWSTCCGCGKAVRTQPDSYSWTAGYRIVNECELVCLSCLDPETYLAECEDDCDKAFPPEWNPCDFGYVKHNGDFETGFHAGQNDSPAEILKLLHSQGKRGVVFRIKGKGQFDLTWETYFKP
jgi:hypothetical protein